MGLNTTLTRSLFGLFDTTTVVIEEVQDESDPDQEVGQSSTNEVQDENDPDQEVGQSSTSYWMWTREAWAGWVEHEAEVPSHESWAELDMVEDEAHPVASSSTDPRYYRRQSVRKDGRIRIHRRKVMEGPLQPYGDPRTMALRAKGKGKGKGKDKDNDTGKGKGKD